MAGGWSTPARRAIVRRVQGGEIRLGEVLAALTYALDLAEGQAAGHALRTCLIGMTLAERLGLDTQQRSELYYAHLLKDAGCSSNASRVAALLEQPASLSRWA